ncbi:MAG TPA: cobalamin-dependent protein, partial [Enhygromyxa sp.]|nr:cobalamin-dependent protein [Enhygromyxa sp.]
MRHKIRVVTAAALFDGHDAAINVMRRILQAHGAEVIHLGHNRGAEEVVDAAIQEDAQAIAVSSYQGGHMEFFKYMHDLLRQKGAPHITIWGGGGGVIVPREIDELHAYGINRIFSPEDGRRHGLDGMIRMIIDGADFSTAPTDPVAKLHGLQRGEEGVTALASLITVLEDQLDGRASKQGDALLRAIAAAEAPRVPVLGLTGTGGAGKSSLTDELVARFARENPERRIAVISVDPTRRRTGGALLGDRIRMNSIRRPNVVMRSMATRASGAEISAATGHAVKLCKLAGYQLILVETSGIGQANSAIDELADVCVYVMTAEYGAQSQLEKIEMLDVADFVAINKFEHKGSKDALRDVRKQVRRNRNLFHELDDEQLPVFGTVASRFNDSGVNGLYAALCSKLSEVGEPDWDCRIPVEQRAVASDTRDIIAPDRVHYLAEVVHTVRAYKANVARQIVVARELEHLRHTRALAAGAVETLGAATLAWLDEQIAATEARLDGDARR